MSSLSRQNAVASKELLEFITHTQRFLMQQQDLFGNIIYTEDMTQRKKEEVSQPHSLYPHELWVETSSLVDLDRTICECLKCPLGHTRTRFVFGVGNPQADVMFVGEAPGADEDAQGEPFVGRAGQLLNKIIEAVALKRQDVYICNILKCRPPNNREPEQTEMETCTPYLYKQIELIKPKFIICLGRISAQWLLQTRESLSNLRGKVHNLLGAQLIVTYHPAALLRNPNWKVPAWEDMKMFKKLYDEQKATA